MQIEGCINFLLTTAQHNVNQYLGQQLSPYDITPSQYGVLDCLWSNDGSCTPKQIADRLCLETSTISGTLERMQKKGLIDRLINEDDRREIIVRICKRGAELEEPVNAIIAHMNETVLNEFEETEKDSLKKQLKKIAFKSLG